MYVCVVEKFKFCILVFSVIVYVSFGLFYLHYFCCLHFRLCFNTFVGRAEKDQSVYSLLTNQKILCLCYNGILFIHISILDFIHKFILSYFISLHHSCHLTDAGQAHMLLQVNDHSIIIHPHPPFHTNKVIRNHPVWLCIHVSLYVSRVRPSFYPKTCRLFPWVETLLF